MPDRKLNVAKFKLRSGSGSKKMPGGLAMTTNIQKLTLNGPTNTHGVHGGALEHGPTLMMTGR